jgi:hypothetical protein
VLQQHEVISVAVPPVLPRTRDDKESNARNIREFNSGARIGIMTILALTLQSRIGAWRP